MIVDADFRGLEVVCAAFLSQDPVLCKEIRDGVNIHEANMAALGLPSELIAKVFKFRLIYGGSAWSYANDADFKSVSTKEKFWQDVIDRYYIKYRGIKEWHEKLVEQVMASGKIVLPTGRSYNYLPEIVLGEKVWPRTTILNYPVQGLGAELMLLVRKLLWSRTRNLSSLLISTVHDSVMWDCPSDLVSKLVVEIEQAWAEVPDEFFRQFGVVFNLPCRVKIKVGPNWGNMEVWK